ncbi:ubiquitin-conjugating enzyme E2 Z-like [Rhipicephalus microplus]|uniref:ubiquitin-conjugating enzyme E2 Z-like n=1 Tax=Rhipicephalus microplus TaxID=6941 RepID=UPI003F6C8077
MWNSSEHSLRTVLIALQSIVTDDPYHNVPALIRGRLDEGGAYNDYLLHETLRVAVCDEVEDALDPGSSYSPELRKFVLMTFLNSYKAHLRTVRLQMRRMVRDGSDPFGGRTTRCDYDFILIRLECLYEIVLDLSESTSCDRAVD